MHSQDRDSQARTLRIGFPGQARIPRTGAPRTALSGQLFQEIITGDPKATGMLRYWDSNSPRALMFLGDHYWDPKATGMPVWAWDGIDGVFACNSTEPKRAPSRTLKTHTSWPPWTGWYSLRIIEEEWRHQMETSKRVTKARSRIVGYRDALVLWRKNASKVELTLKLANTTWIKWTINTDIDKSNKYIIYILDYEFLV
jgi:hypothetical protein